jgi:NTE family protein
LGLVKRDRFKELLNTVFGNMHLNDLFIPFKVVCVDVISGEQVILDDSPVITAILASSSIPILFEPIEYNGKILVDGGLTNNVPADVVRGMGADVVISIDLNRDIRQFNKPQNIFDMIYSSFKIVINNSAMQQCQTCSDIIITPNLRGYGYYDLNKLNELITLGEEAAREKMSEIKRAIL